MIKKKVKSDLSFDFSGFLFHFRFSSHLPHKNLAELFKLMMRVKIQLVMSSVFQHDDVHKASSSLMAWCVTDGVEDLECAAQRPDLNPSEHIWYVLTHCKVDTKSGMDIHDLHTRPVS